MASAESVRWSIDQRVKRVQQPQAEPKAPRPSFFFTNRYSVSVEGSCINTEAFAEATVIATQRDEALARREERGALQHGANIKPMGPVRRFRFTPGKLGK